LVAWFSCCRGKSEGEGKPLERSIGVVVVADMVVDI
jgi:hypothetical protein